MELLENNQAKKRRMPSVKTLVLAAALAAGCLLSIAAGLPAQVYHFMIGGSVTVIPGSDYAVFAPAGVSPVVTEDGRLWLTIGGERKDITDLVDENTPYIRENADPETGNKGCLVVGGTPEHFGWIEFSVMDGHIEASTGINYCDGWVTLPDGRKVNELDLTDEQRAQVAAADESGFHGVVGQSVNRPWFDAALNQLGIEK